MVKSKIVKKKDNIKIVIKEEKGQQLNEPELHVLKGEIRGLLPIDVEFKMKKFRLSYDITGYIPFKEYLKMPLTSDSLARLLRSIINLLKDMDDLFLKQENILFDPDRVMINAMQQSANFIYMPLRFYETGTSLREFLLSIVQYGTFDKNEDNGYVKEYIRILNEGINFSAFDLEEYVKRLEKNDFRETNKQVQCIHCKTLLAEKTKFCPVCGTKVFEEVESVKDDVYNPLAHIDKPRLEQTVREIEEPVINGTQGLSDETTLLGASYGGTTVLGVRDFFTEHNPYLTRKKNNERILIKSDEFRVGKRPTENDYVVNDNTNVSGKHAKFIVHDEQVFIMDIGSLNGTKVNGVFIPKNQEYKLSDKDEIKLADEEFTFSVED